MSMSPQNLNHTKQFEGTMTNTFIVLVPQSHSCRGPSTCR